MKTRAAVPITSETITTDGSGNYSFTDVGPGTYRVRQILPAGWTQTTVDLTPYAGQTITIEFLVHQDGFGDDTIGVMRDGCHLLAVLWESAWSLGDGEHTIGATTALTQKKAMQICADREFLPSLTIDRIGATLTRPAGSG